MEQRSTYSRWVGCPGVHEPCIYLPEASYSKSGHLSRENFTSLELKGAGYPYAPEGPLIVECTLHSAWAYWFTKAGTSPLTSALSWAAVVKRLKGIWALNEMNIKFVSFISWRHRYSKGGMIAYWVSPRGGVFGWLRKRAQSVKLNHFYTSAHV